MRRSAEADAGRAPCGVHIVRGPGPRRIAAYCFRDFEVLARDARVGDLGRQCVFSDLSLGPWRGHWVARELSRQLGLAEPTAIQPCLYGDKVPLDAYADTIGSLIDEEGGGDRNFSTAHEWACRIVCGIDRWAISHVFIVVPQEGSIWGTENLYLIRLLADAARRSSFQLWCLSRGDRMPTPVAGIEWISLNAPTVIEQDAPGCPLPGLLPATPADGKVGSSSSCLRLRDGSLLVSPNARSHDAGAEQMRSLCSLALPEYLRASPALHDPSRDVDLLQRQVGERFAEGGYDIALAILNRVDMCALDVVRRAAVQVQRQNIAIALMRFDLAAEGDPPDEKLPDATKASLYQSKGWGLTMLGRASEAHDYLVLATRHSDAQRLPRLTLYLQNILALAELKSGRTEQALALEKQIEACLDSLPVEDWHLSYINRLNLARVHKKIGHLEQAAMYYRRAFLVTLNARTESDLLYVNLCEARLAARRGNRQAAFDNWMRAAIHWLSNPLPEALAPRVAQEMLGGPLIGVSADVEQVSAALNDALLDAAGKSGFAFEPAARAVAFSRLECAGAADACLAHQGWAIAVSRGERASPVFVGVQYDTLARTVIGILAAYFPRFDFAQAQAFMSDARCGVELPGTIRQAFWSCWCYGIPELIYAGQHYPISPCEDEALGKLVVRISLAVKAIHPCEGGLMFHFKRYLTPIELADRESAIVKYLDEPKTMAELAEQHRASIRDCAAWIRSLEDKRVVAVI